MCRIHVYLWRHMYIRVPGNIFPVQTLSEKPMFIDTHVWHGAFMCVYLDAFIRVTWFVHTVMCAITASNISGPSTSGPLGKRALVGAATVELGCFCMPRSPHECSRNNFQRGRELIDFFSWTKTNDDQNIQTIESWYSNPESFLIDWQRRVVRHNILKRQNEAS